MRLDFEEFLSPKGLKIGDKIKLSGDDTVYELIIADNCLYLYDAETCTIRNPLDLQRDFEVIKPKKKVGDLICDENMKCEKCPLRCFDCLVNTDKTLRGRFEATLKKYPQLEPMRPYFEKELDKEVEE